MKVILYVLSLYVLYVNMGIGRGMGMTFKELERMLKEDGWVRCSVRGSHFYYTHPVKAGKVTIPNHKGDLKMGTVQAILKQAGLK